MYCRRRKSGHNRRHCHGGCAMGITAVLAVAVALVLAFVGRGFLAWIAAGGVWLVGWRLTGIASPLAFEAVAGTLLVLAVLFGLPPLRRLLISRAAMRTMAKVLPRLGDTERIALEAGTVWWDAVLFSGMPRWQELLDFEVKPLTD